ncbi:MAG: signal peptidase II [Huintestinicola sp.]
MILLFWILSAAFVFIDFITKRIAADRISIGEIYHVITAGDTDILSFTMFHNTGAAFSSFTGKTVILAVVTIIAMAAMTVYFHKEKHKHPVLTVSFAMIIGGGIGNLIDRIMLSYVIDFICLWPFTFVFNFSDICIVLGAILLAVYYLFIDEKYKKRFAEVVPSGESTNSSDGENADE